MMWLLGGVGGSSKEKREKKIHVHFRIRRQWKAFLVAAVKKDSFQMYMRKRMGKAEDKTMQGGRPS